MCSCLSCRGCATFKPQPVDLQAYENRTKVSVSGDVAVTVAVPTIAEAQAIYGAKLASKHIQPVWVEVKNDSAEPYWLLAQKVYDKEMKKINYH